MVNVIELTKERERQGFVRTQKYEEISRSWADLRDKNEHLAGWQTSQERKQCLRYGQNPYTVYGSYAEHYQQTYQRIAQNHVNIFTLPLETFDELEAMGRHTTFYNAGEDIPYVYCRALQGTSTSTASTTTISPQQAQQWSAEFAQQQEEKQTPTPTQAPETPQNHRKPDDYQGPMTTDEAGL